MSDESSIFCDIEELCLKSKTKIKIILKIYTFLLQKYIKYYRYEEM